MYVSIPNRRIVYEWTSAVKTHCLCAVSLKELHLFESDLQNFDRNEMFENGCVNSAEMLDEQRIIMWQTLSGKILPEIQHIVEFAKSIPGEFLFSLLNDGIREWKKFRTLCFKKWHLV